MVELKRVPSTLAYEEHRVVLAMQSDSGLNEVATLAIVRKPFRDSLHRRVTATDGRLLIAPLAALPDSDLLGEVCEAIVRDCDSISNELRLELKTENYLLRSRWVRDPVSA